MNNKMSHADLVNQAKDLKLTDNNELVCEVIISYSTISKATALAFGRTKGAGNDGFLGIYKNELVCFDSNIFGSKPHKERFRFPFETIDKVEIKKGFLGLNNQFIVRSGAHQFNLNFGGKHREYINQMHRKILQSK